MAVARTLVCDEVDAAVQLALTPNVARLQGYEIRLPSNGRFVLRGVASHDPFFGAE